MKRVFIIILIILNALVLLGQLWPAGAPPFARIMNILFLSVNLIFCVYLLIKKNKN